MTFKNFINNNYILKPKKKLLVYGKIFSLIFKRNIYMKLSLKSIRNRFNKILRPHFEEQQLTSFSGIVIFQWLFTKLNSKTLIEISEIGNGVYIDGKNTAEVTEQTTSILSNLDKKEFEAKEFSEYKDQFQWFLGIALFFIVLDVFLLERKTAWLKRLNLFNENSWLTLIIQILVLPDPVRVKFGIKLLPQYMSPN